MDIYHILNRGANKSNIVKDDSDRLRFVQSLFIFNDRNSAPNSIVQTRKWSKLDHPRKLLVHVHAWCLMDNHYHLLISPIDDEFSNISLFMKKLNMGYAKFFNEKYEHSGCLWQGKYKRILINNDAHFNYIPYYIHLNPLDFKLPKWRDGQVKDSKDAIDSLQKYRWSSFLDYQGTHNFPSLLYTDLLKDILLTPAIQSKVISKIISDTNSLHSEASKILEK